MSISSKIIRNTVFNTVGSFWGMLIAVLLTPYIVSHIGVERFGIWAIVGVVTGYFGLLDCGVSSSFVKYFSEFYAQKKFTDMNRLISTGVIFYTAIGIVITAAIALLADPILALFRIPAPFCAEARFVMIVATVILCASNAMGAFIAVLPGLQRMDISNAIQMTGALIGAAGTVFFLQRGWGLRGLIINNAIVFAVTIFLTIVMAGRVFPELRCNLLVWDGALFRRSFVFGYKVQATRITGMMVMQADKILLASFLSIGLVTFYQLGSSVVYYALALLGIMVSALLPAFSAIDALGERAKLVEGYLRSTKYMSFLVAPVILFTIITAHKVIFIWMGSGYEKSGFVIQILAAAFALNTVARVASSLAMAIDRPGFMARNSILTIVLDIVFSVALIKMMGFYGAAWGAAIAVNTGTLYFYAMLHKHLAITNKEFASRVVPYFMVALAAGAVTWVIDIVAGILFSAPTRVGMLALLSAEGIIFCLVYISGITMSKCFNADDIEFFRSKIPLLSRIFRTSVTKG